MHAPTIPNRRLERDPPDPTRCGRIARDLWWARGAAVRGAAVRRTHRATSTRPSSGCAAGGRAESTACPTGPQQQPGWQRRDPKVFQHASDRLQPHSPPSLLLARPPIFIRASRATYQIPPEAHMCDLRAIAVVLSALLTGGFLAVLGAVV